NPYVPIERSGLSSVDCISGGDSSRHSNVSMDLTGIGYRDQAAHLPLHIARSISRNTEGGSLRFYFLVLPPLNSCSGTAFDYTKSNTKSNMKSNTKQIRKMQFLCYKSFSSLRR